jgi:hypothetical protein
LTRRLQKAPIHIFLSCIFLFRFCQQENAGEENMDCGNSWAFEKFMECIVDQLFVIVKIKPDCNVRTPEPPASGPSPTTNVIINRVYLAFDMSLLIIGH